MKPIWLFLLKMTLILGVSCGGSTITCKEPVLEEEREYLNVLANQEQGYASS